MIRVASFNVENLFARPKASNQSSWDAGQTVLKAYEEVNRLFEEPVYTAPNEARIVD